MTFWPGDTVGDRFTVTRLVAYMGNPDCTSWRCTRLGSHQRDDGTWDAGKCYGWHCSLCDAPCGLYGHHDCPRAGDTA
jgi:hypothetical protein